MGSLFLIALLKLVDFQAQPELKFLSMSVHPPEFEVALGLFNQARFFEAHEALEDLWRRVAGSSPAKKHLQGLVQLAVAFHHESRGNFRGARSVLHRARRNLVGAELSFPNLEFEKLQGQLAAWQDYVDDRKHRPPLPTITLRVPSSRPSGC